MCIQPQHSTVCASSMMTSYRHNRIMTKIIYFAEKIEQVIAFAMVSWMGQFYLTQQIVRSMYNAVGGNRL